MYDIYISTPLKQSRINQFFEPTREGRYGILSMNMTMTAVLVIQKKMHLTVGMAEYELPEARRSKKGAKPVDGHPWIWKDFASRGYRTLWIEDGPDIGTFTYRMVGFKDQPTDVYGRVQWLARREFSVYHYQQRQQQQQQQQQQQKTTTIQLILVFIKCLRNE